jgi:hypothetical protein
MRIYQTVHGVTGIEVQAISHHPGDDDCPAYYARRITIETTDGKLKLVLFADTESKLATATDSLLERC